MERYEHLSMEVEKQINNKLDMLRKRRNMMTESEMQYLFIRFLDTLSLTKKEVFDIYTNTTL